MTPAGSSPVAPELSIVWRPSSVIFFSNRASMRPRDLDCHVPPRFALSPVSQAPFADDAGWGTWTVNASGATRNE